MNIRYLTTMLFVLTLFFLSSCAVFVRGGGYHHGFRHWRSSIQQSDQSLAQLTAQYNEDFGRHDQVSR